MYSCYCLRLVGCYPDSFQYAVDPPTLQPLAHDVVPGPGLEPGRLAAGDFKSLMSAIPSAWVSRLFSYLHLVSFNTFVYLVPC